MSLQHHVTIVLRRPWFVAGLEMTGLPGCAASALRHKAAVAGQGEISFHMASWQGDTSSSQHSVLQPQLILSPSFCSRQRISSFLNLPPSFHHLGPAHLCLECSFLR